MMDRTGFFFWGSFCGFLLAKRTTCRKNLVSEFLRLSQSKRIRPLRNHLSECAVAPKGRWSAGTQKNPVLLDPKEPGSFGENPKEPSSFYGVLFVGFFWQNHSQGAACTFSLSFTPLPAGIALSFLLVNRTGVRC
jgi:hypothetical protein